MNSIVAIFIDGLVYSSWLFIVAVGLTLIYGVMKILNIAHGSFYAIGAYTAASLTGSWLAQGYDQSTAFLIVLVLVTYALFLMLEDIIKLVWGVNPYFLYQPYGLLGSFEIVELTYPNYNLLLIGCAITIGCFLTWFLQKTRHGKILLAVIHDREITSTQGINVDRVYFLTFTLGTVLAALGGVLTAPMISVQPGIGAETIVMAFAVVVVGGLGSLPGAALAAILIGLVRSGAVHLFPDLDLFSIYLVMATVLIFKPKGLFSAQEERKI